MSRPLGHDGQRITRSPRRSGEAGEASEKVLAKDAKAIRKAERERDGTLAGATREIVRLHNEIMDVCGNLIFAKKIAVVNAVKIGALLIRIRASRQGEWLDWLRCNVKFSHDTALRYIACFEQRDELAAAKINSLSDAYTLLLPPVSRSKSTKALRSVRNDSLGKAVAEYVRKGIATDEKAARRILAKRSEQPGDATTDEKAELQDEAPKAQPKGWQPDVLDESDLSHEERQAIKPLRAYLASTPSGRARVVLRFVCEKLGSEL